MNDLEWKIKVETSLTEIKSDIRYIKEKLPDCQQHVVKQSLKINRRLIFVVIVAYIPVLIMLLANR